MPSDKIVFGIDNGVSGTVAVFHNGKLIDFQETPVKKWLKPTVKSRASYMARIDVKQLVDWLRFYSDGNQSIAVIERSMTDQRRFHATLSSHHAQEAIMIALEWCNIPYMTIDSSVWQKRELKGVSGSEFLKRASMEKCLKDYPQFEYVLKKHGDGDAILIAKTAVIDPSCFVSDLDRKPVKVDKEFKKKFKTNFSNKGNDKCKSIS